MGLVATPAVLSNIKKYKYIYKFNDREFYAINSEKPFKDDDDVDTYKLLGREKLECPLKQWIPTSEF